MARIASREDRATLLLLFVVGLAASLFLVFRGQVGADQINLLARGWLLAEKGQFVPYGNPTSAGGFEAGGASTLLVGAPLLLWRDARAPVLFIVLLQAIAYGLLDRLLRQTAGTRERILFAVVYWLSPWRLYHSGFLWNPNYLFAAGAVHASTLWAQRRRGSAGLSLLHVVTIGLAMQLHPSSIWLVLATGLLVSRGYAKLHWGGAAAGALLIAASLVPWGAAVARDPSLLPGGEGFPGRGLVFVFPLVRGLLYWLRYGSLWLTGKMVRFEFATALGPGVAALLDPLARAFSYLAAAASLAWVVPATVRFLRRPRGLMRVHDPGSSGRSWLLGYARLGFVAGAAAFALAPTTVMSWQGIILFHAAVLPVVLWAGALSRTRAFSRVRASAFAWTVASVLLAAAIGLGGARYHCVQRTPETPTLRHDHPMLHELGVHDRCPPITDDPEGWWTDVLAPQEAAEP